MEIPRRAEHDRLAGLDPLRRRPVRPLARHLERGLDRLRARVHRQHPLVPKRCRHLPREPREHRVVERARGQRELLRLRDERGDDLGVAVALVHRAGDM